MELDTTVPFRGSEAIRDGHLTRGVLRGPSFRCLDADTYVAADAADDALLPVRAALVRAGPTAVATGWSACVVLGLDITRSPKPVEITVADRRMRTGPATVVRGHRLADDEITRENGVRVTTAIRTAFDLASRAAPDRMAVDRVIGPLVDAVVAADALARRGGFDGAGLSAFAARHPGARGVRRVATVAQLLDPGAASPPETRVRVQVVLAGLPRPTLQHRVVVFGGLSRFLDLAWPDFMVAVEYDGRDHARSDRRGRDVDRLDALRRAGWKIIVATAVQLARPSWVADRVREALMSRGWRSGPDDWAWLREANRARAHSW